MTGRHHGFTRSEVTARALPEGSWTATQLGLAELRDPTLPQAV